MELSGCGSFIYIGGIIVLHVFTSLFGGLPLCIP